MKKTNIDPNSVRTAAVAASAYGGSRGQLLQGPSLLHSVNINFDPPKPLCSKVKASNLLDDPFAIPPHDDENADLTTPPTCPICLSKDPRFPSGANMAGGYRSKAKALAIKRGAAGEFYDLSRQGQYVYDARPTPMVLLEAHSSVKEAEHSMDDARKAWDRASNKRANANRAGTGERIPKPLDLRQVQALRPNADLFHAADLSMRMREQHVRAFLRAHGEQVFEVQLPHKGRRRSYFAVVHQETVAGPDFGAWRVSYFDERGAIGHAYGRGFMKKGETSNYLGVLRQLVRDDGADLSTARF